MLYHGLPYYSMLYHDSHIVACYIMACHIVARYIMVFLFEFNYGYTLVTLAESAKAEGFHIVKLL